MKALITIKTIVLASLCMLWMISCTKDEVSIEQQIEFSFGSSEVTSGSGRMDQSEWNFVDAVVITITDNSGKEVISGKILPVYKFNDHYVTEPVTLKKGSYKLTKFLVIDELRQVRYVCPVEGSQRAHLVDSRLPFSFSVYEGEVRSIALEVLPVGDASPRAFGYAGFDFDVLEVIDFYVNTFIFNEETQKTQLTNANLTVTSFGYSHQYDLKERSIPISVSDNHPFYTLTIDKPGYKTYSEKFSFAQLGKYVSEPLLVVLEQTFSFTVECNIRDYNNIRPELVESMILSPSDPSKLIVATRNYGANCGSGTPAAIWHDNLNQPASNASYVQSLGNIQNTRNTFFANSSNTLFTGSGWCGYKPSFYSTDGGNSWLSSISGPPNSTFSFAEFKGNTYVGTGYEPYLGQIYKWTGGGQWNHVYDLAIPRTIVTSMVAFDGKLFVGSSNYWGGGQTGGTPVLVSSDGINFSPTTGIDSRLNIQKLFEVGNKLMALVSSVSGFPALFEWNGTSWKPGYNLELRSLPGTLLTVMDDKIVMFAKAYVGQHKIWISDNHGRTWHKIPWTYPEISYLYSEANKLYLGTKKSSAGGVMVYRLDL